MTRRWLDAAGLAVGVVALGFVASRLVAYAGQIPLDRLTPAVWLQLAGLALISGAANALLGKAWQHCLAQDGVRVPARWAIRIHGVSQLGRYVPGNVFQFAGRQALGLAAGLPGKPLAKSVLRELGSLALVGAALAVPALGGGWTVPVAVLALVGVLAAAQFVGPAQRQAALWHLAFLLGYSGVFVGVVQSGQPHAIEPLPLASAFILAWLAGLVTPGAPAGGGVREAILLALLGPRIAEADLLLAIVLGRAVNVAGDVLFFAFASSLRAPEPGHAAA